MNPEAVTARFITAHHRRGGAQAEPLPPLLHHALDRPQIPSWHRPDHRLHAEPRRQRKLPLLLPHLERYKQRRLTYTDRRAGRCSHHKLLSALKKLSELNCGTRLHSPSVVGPRNVVAKNLDEQTDRLYQLPLDQFTAARNALAKEAGSEGASIKQLVKPPLAAWAVNQL